MESPIRLPTEFGLHMTLDKVCLIQQSELGEVAAMNLFDEDSPCHIYFICKRARITIVPNSLETTRELFSLKFRVQKQENFTEVKYTFQNNFGTADLDLVTNYPYSTFQIQRNGESLVIAKAAPFLQKIPTYYTEADFLDLDVLYVGQSYGVDGARTAPDRLKNHSTLQGIYAEAIQNNPDSEIWLLLASFHQLTITMMDGRTQYTDEQIANDEKRRPKVYEQVLVKGISEQQRINFTEASLIKYFEPPYNQIYKDSFPNPAHRTYSECYDLEINSISVELDTGETLNCKLFSDKIAKKSEHMFHFTLHSAEKRKSMFEILPGMPLDHLQNP